MRWILALAKPNQEGLACDHLSRQGYEPYCPRYKETRPNKVAVIKPLFPRYIFVGIDQHWYSVRGTRGISHVLLNADGPQFVHENIIRDIKQREYGGLVSLTHQERFERGAAVKCDTGPLAGIELIYQHMSGKDRCAVLAHLLGNYVKVDVPEKSLVAA